MKKKSLSCFNRNCQLTHCACGVHLEVEDPICLCPKDDSEESIDQSVEMAERLAGWSLTP